MTEVKFFKKIKTGGDQVCDMPMSRGTEIMIFSLLLLLQDTVDLSNTLSFCYGAKYV